MNQDNGFNNADELYSDGQGENEVRPEPPSLIHLLLYSMISVVAAFFVPELGLLSVILFSACTVFVISSGAALPVQLIPVLGVLSLILRGGYFWMAVMAAVWMASLVAGHRLRLGKTFQQALLPYMLMLISAAAVAAALYTRKYGITADDISDAMKTLVHDMMASAIESAGDTIPLERAYLLMEQHEAVAAVAATFIPAAVGMAISLIGIIALRLAGLFHTVSGSEMYPEKNRLATVDITFTVVWILSMLIGVIDPAGVAGACASNIMMVLLFPAAAAGITECRFMIVRRRLEGRRGLPFAMFFVIISFIITPGAGLIVLGFMGTVFSALRRLESRMK
ncbi:MAG: hypothetical protein IJ386_03800 [Clostridia bacterium]|nr:hypothetical protein [Clostridia bacterium]